MSCHDLLADLPLTASIAAYAVALTLAALSLTAAFVFAADLLPLVEDIFLSFPSLKPLKSKYDTASSIRYDNCCKTARVQQFFFSLLFFSYDS